MNCKHKTILKKFDFYMNDKRYKMCKVKYYCKFCGLVTKEYETECM